MVLMRSSWAMQVLVGALVAGVSGGAFAGDWTLADLMRLLAQQKSGRASFVEKKFIGIMDRPVESSGELSFTAPDKLEKHTLKPRSERLLLDGDSLTVTQGEKRPLLVNLQEHPEAAAVVEGIRGTLLGDLGALEKNYALELSGSASKWQLVLTPTQASVVKTIRRIRMAGAEAQVKTIDIEQSDGDRSEMVISKPLAP